MARYTGPKTKKARSFGEAIYGYDKWFEKRKSPPGQHGNGKRKGTPSEYAIQLKEKQKAKYTYGLLERQFAKTFKEAARKSGVTGEILLQLLELRLDNVIYTLGYASSRREARQLIPHTVGTGRVKKYNWLSFDNHSLSGHYLEVPSREMIPENIKEQLIVELYSK